MLLLITLSVVVNANSEELNGYYDEELERRYRDCFSSSRWIYRDNGIALSVTHKNVYNYTADEAYEALYYWHHKNGASPYWPYSSDRSMKDQFVCHYDWAYFKNPWNLEPWRPEGAGLGNGCNPDSWEGRMWTH